MNKKIYTFKAAGADLWDRRSNTPNDGDKVIKTQPAGCPRNGTMGHCFVATPEGKFIGLVCEGSLRK